MTTLLGHNGNTPLYNCSDTSKHKFRRAWALNQHQYVLVRTTYIKALNQKSLPEHNRCVLCDKLPDGYRTDHLDCRMDEKPTLSHKHCVSHI